MLGLDRLMNITSSIYGRPKQSYYNDFVAMSDLAWTNAPNVFDENDLEHERVQYEVEYGEKNFEYISARVDSVVNPSTGKSMGDDYKAFIFKPDAPEVYIGKLFKWMNSFWLCINANSYESMTNGCVVRQCNNRLKWIDNNGILRIEPCIMAYDIQQANDYDGKVLTTTGGFTRILCQKNMTTDLISQNMRFLFGTPRRRKAYKITAGGLRNYLNSETENDYSTSIIEIWASNDYTNENTDDLENGIANAFINQFTLNIEQSYISNVVGYNTRLIANVKRDEIIVDVPVNWVSDNENIATIDEEGNLILVGLGNTIITAYIGNNKEVKDTINISVIEEIIASEYEIILTPDINYVLEGQTEIFECKLYKNGEEQFDEFIFSNVSKNIPYANYLFNVIDGNHFTIYNKKKLLGNFVLINCSNNNESKTFDFELKGAY